MKVWWCIYSYICLCPRYIMWICRNGVVLYKIIFLRKWISRMQRRKRKRRRRQKDIFMQRIFAHCTSSSSYKLCIYAFLYMLAIWWNKSTLEILLEIMIHVSLFSFYSLNSFYLSSKCQLDSAIIRKYHKGNNLANFNLEQKGTSTKRERWRGKRSSCNFTYFCWCVCYYY